MIRAFLKKILGTHADRALKTIWPIVDEINAAYEELSALSDDDLRSRTWDFRRRLQQGETLDALLPEAFAVVKEACRRHVGQSWTANEIPIEWVEVPYDVQLVGAVTLYQGKIAEMATGEGKTLVAIMPLYLRALEGKGCHLATFNDFLAKLGSEWAGRILQWLGLTVGCIQQQMEPEERRRQYACDVTYGQSSEFGFDYLRDNMATSAAQLVQGARSLISQEIAEEIAARVQGFDGGRVVTDHFRTFIVDVPEQRVPDLLEEFAERFTLESIDVLWSGETPAAALPEPGVSALKIGEETASPRVQSGLARVRFQFLPREHHYAIVDEVDSLLIDEARTPLIISGQVDRSTHRYDQMRPLVENLVRQQTQLVNGLVREAGDLLKEDNPDSRYQAGIKLLQVKKSMPKNKRFMKLHTEPDIARLVTRVENDFMIDQKSKMGEKSMGFVEEDLYFVVDEKGHSVDLTERGRELVSPDDPDRFLLADLVDEYAKIENDSSLEPAAREARKAEVARDNDLKSEELHNISQLLRAYTLFEQDVDYVVEDNKIIIVDEFTGRPQPGRRYSDGLHQAIEAKERVKIEKESQTLATITIQNYFRMYDTLAGMTGTAETEAAEFGHTYQMDVVVMPTHRPIARIDYDDVIYRTRREKYNAIVEEVQRLHAMKQPILIGTVSVEASELLSRMLRRAGISHSVLNAKHIAKEAEIVRAAGQAGAVTIATNMAGRGTDIKLGAGVIRCKEEDHGGPYCAACPFKPEGAKVDPDMQPCGLQIIGTERHEARRIDRQLRGRSGRQGDPGSTRFFLSLEDDLMRLFGSERISGILERLGLEEGEEIQHHFITKAIERAQRKIEEMNFERRKRTLDYDNVMNKQREAIYGLRREVLISDNLRDVMLDVAWDALGAQSETFRNDETAVAETGSPFDFDGFEGYLRAMVPGLDFEGIERPSEGPDGDYNDAVIAQIGKAYDLKRDLLGPELTNELARYIALNVIDTEWRDHLRGIDELREGIHLRSYAQLDPLVEYQREATYMFQDMMRQVQRIVFEHFFRANVVTERQRPTAPTSDVDYGRGDMEGVGAGVAAGDAENAATNAPDQPRRPRTYRRDQPKVGRNDPCPCGSGKKYKKCCGKNE